MQHGVTGKAKRKVRQVVIRTETNHIGNWSVLITLAIPILMSIFIVMAVLTGIWLSLASIGKNNRDIRILNTREKAANLFRG